MNEGMTKYAATKAASRLTRAIVEPPQVASSQVLNASYGKEFQTKQ